MKAKLTCFQRSLPTAYGKDIYEIQAQSESEFYVPIVGDALFTEDRTQWTFLSFFVLFEIGSLICGVANSSALLIVGRVIAGLGTSGMLNGAMLIVAECAPMERRPSMNQCLPDEYVRPGITDIVYSFDRHCDG